MKTKNKIYGYINRGALIGSILLLSTLSGRASNCLFCEDFESYAVGSDLNGQGGWTTTNASSPGAPPDALIINDAGPLPTKVLDGLDKTGSSQNVVLHPLPSSLPDGMQTILKFDAYAQSADSHNSGCGLLSGTVFSGCCRIGWFNQAFTGWYFEVEQAGQPSILVLAPGGFDAPVHFTIVFDRSANEVWGTYDFGSGPVETAHYSVLPNTLGSLNNVEIDQEFRYIWHGVQLDNISLAPPCSPPVIQSISANPSSIWPPNNTMVPVTLSISATANCGIASEKIISVSSNEAGSGQYQITGDLTVNLLAQRNGSGAGRIYTITVQVTDTAGNVTMGTTTVTVPHSQGH